VDETHKARMSRTLIGKVRKYNGTIVEMDFPDYNMYVACSILSLEPH
jgi:hypothetical protein